MTSDYAPVNPEFIKYLEMKKFMSVSGLERTISKYGEIPSPYYNPVRDLQMFDTAVTQTYSSSYDLTTSDRVTSVKNQNPYGTCWAHATYGSLESNLKPSETADYSEKNLVNIGGGDFDISQPNGGGNLFMASAYLTRWNGPVNEATDIYPSASGWTSSSSYSPVKHIQKVIIFPGRSLYTDTNNFKGSLINFGAVYSSLWWDDANYNSANHAYYEPTSFTENPATGGGHALTIVGWDDNYPSSSFNTAPAGDGAWKVKNSWGSSWGDNGYFWVSYYDRRFASKIQPDSTKDSAVFTAGPVSNYETVYNYDPLGMVSALGNGVDLTRSFANVFTASSAGTLNAVGFYTTEPDARYTISVYKNPSPPPAGGTELITFSGLLPYMGYNTVMVPSGVTVSPGDLFSIVVSVTNPANSYLIPIQYPLAGYSSASTGIAGHGYYVSGSTWTDITSSIANSAVCVKAYVSPSASSGSTTNIGVYRGGNWYLDHDASFSWSADDLIWVKTFGHPGDIPVTGDWNGDGKEEIGVFIKGVWYLDHDGSNSWTPDDMNWIKNFGLNGDIPVVGDWNQDGIDELGVYRGSGVWYLDHDASYSWTADDLSWIRSFGISGDIPVVGDWNGDRKDEIGVYRGGTWYLDHDASFSWSADDLNWIKSFGLPGDKPVVGDWNGDKVDELSVYRGGTWYLDHDASFSWSADDLNWIKSFGLPGDIPVTGSFSVFGTTSVNKVAITPQPTPTSRIPVVALPNASVPRIEMPVISQKPSREVSLPGNSTRREDPLNMRQPIVSNRPDIVKLPIGAGSSPF